MIDKMQRPILQLLIILTAILPLSGLAQKPPSTLGEKSAMVYDLSIQAPFRILAASLGDRIEVWNYHNKEIVKSWAAPKIIAIDFRDSLLVGVSKTGFLFVWNAFTANEIVKTKIADSPLTSVRFIDQGSIVVGTDSGEIIRFNIAMNKIEFVKKIKGTVSAIVVMPERQIMVVGDNVGTLTIFNQHNGTVISSAKGHRSWIRRLQTYGEGNMISFSDDGYFKNWKLTDSARLGLVSKKRPGGWILCGDAFQEKKDGPILVATGFQNGSARVYFTFGRYEFNTKGFVNNIVIIKEDFPKINLVVGTYGNGIQLISAEELKMVKPRGK